MRVIGETSMNLLDQLVSILKKKKSILNVIDVSVLLCDYSLPNQMTRLLSALPLEQQVSTGLLLR